MTPLPQLNFPELRKRIIIRAGFYFLFILILLSENILLLPTEAQISLFPSQEDKDLPAIFTPDLSWFFSSKRPLPFIPSFQGEPFSPRKDQKQIKQRPKVAIIIDDVGFVCQPTEDFWELDIPLTFAILPWGKYSQLHAKQALERNHEVILHLPLEPLDPSICPGPGVLLGSFSADQLLQQLRENLHAIPGVIGVNNHMGSKGTQDPKIIKLVMSELKLRNLFFIDSMTIHSSQGWLIAQEMQVPVGTRDVFIDSLGIEGIPLQINILIEKALQQGTAIGIAHTRPGVAKALADSLPLFQAAQIELVPISTLVK